METSVFYLAFVEEGWSFPIDLSHKDRHSQTRLVRDTRFGNLSRKATPMSNFQKCEVIFCSLRASRLLSEVLCVHFKRNVLNTRSIQEKLGKGFVFL